VLAAIVWVGSELYIHFQYARARGRGPEAEAGCIADFNRWGNTVLPGMAVLLIITGVLAVIEGPWEFSQAWISIGLTVWVLTFIAGVGFYGPTGKKIAAFVEADGDRVTERSAPLIARTMLVSRVELVLLAIVVIAMVTKPGV